MPGRIHITQRTLCEALHIHHSAGHDSHTFWWLLYSAGDPTNGFVADVNEWVQYQGEVYRQAGLEGRRLDPQEQNRELIKYTPPPIRLRSLRQVGYKEAS